MLKVFYKYFNDHPFRFIIATGLIIRLISVVFSTGYGMHDDHYLVVEAAQSWVDGYDYNQWLPWNRPDGVPTGHSFFYVGLHYLFFAFLKMMNLDDPLLKMFLLRLFHALWSMVTVVVGYKLTERIYDKKSAVLAGLLLSLLWFYPILSVRNMVEMVCVPFVLLSFYYVSNKNMERKKFILAGVFMGLAVAVRLQVYLLLGGLGLVLFMNRKISGAIIFGISSLIALFITQITDLFFWHKPFAELTQYILYNSSHYDEYVTQAWYQYLILIAGLLLPPLSLMIIFGYFRGWRKNLFLFLPSIIFLAFHSIYPNKQERFILPVIPLVIILGCGGWQEFVNQSAFWIKRANILNVSLRIFWSINIVALLFVSPAPTKKSRVETMYRLRELSDVTGLFLERTSSFGCYLLPRFYHGNWTIPHFCYSGDEVSKYTDDDLKSIAEKKGLNYCLFIENDEIDARVEKMHRIFPSMRKVADIKPSYIDRILHYLNPVNENETIYIYRLFTQDAKV